MEHSFISLFASLFLFYCLMAFFFYCCFDNIKFLHFFYILIPNINIPSLKFTSSSLNRRIYDEFTKRDNKETNTDDDNEPKMREKKDFVRYKRCLIIT